jgi:hypothetical protein
MDLKTPKQSGAEAGAQGTIHSITSSCHHNAPDTGVIVPSVECIPPRPFGSVQVHFEPRGEIHVRRVCRNTDIAEIARGVARGNVQASAKRDRKMRKVTTNTDLLEISLRRGPGGVRLLIIKLKSIVDVIHDRLDAVPAPQLEPKRFQASCESLSVSQ